MKIIVHFTNIHHNKNQTRGIKNEYRTMKNNNEIWSPIERSYDIPPNTPPKYFTMLTDSWTNLQLRQICRTHKLFGLWRLPFSHSRLFECSERWKREIIIFRRSEKCIFITIQGDNELRKFHSLAHIQAVSYAFPHNRWN